MAISASGKSQDFCAAKKLQRQSRAFKCFHPNDCINNLSYFSYSFCHLPPSTLSKSPVISLSLKAFCDLSHSLSKWYRTQVFGFLHSLILQSRLTVANHRRCHCRSPIRPSQYLELGTLHMKSLTPIRFMTCESISGCKEFQVEVDGLLNGFFCSVFQIPCVTG